MQDMNKKDRKKLFLGCGATTFFIAIVIATFLVTSNSNPQITLIEIKSRKFELVPMAGPPGGNETGLVYIYTVPHSADPGTDYASNWSGTIYEHDTGLNKEMNDTTPFNTAFDILYLIQIDYDDGFNKTSGHWDNDYVYFLLTSADLGIGADTNLTEIHVANCSSEMYLHYYANNGGAGYTLSHNQKVNLTSEKLYIYR